MNEQLVPGLQVVTPIMPLLRDLPLLVRTNGEYPATYRALRRSLPLVLDARTDVHRRDGHWRMS